MKTIVVASQNAHKIKEMENIMKGMGYEVISRADAGVPDSLDIVEDGETFEENSFKKADAIMRATGKIALADDSGLSVDALNGAPGVHSARFAGEPCDDEKNNDKLLELMKDIPEEKRTAAFVSVITIVWPDGSKLTVRGECRGVVLKERRGDHGFGYDPLFLPDGQSETFAEISSEVKNQISHRAKALQKLEELLRERDL